MLATTAIVAAAIQTSVRRNPPKSGRGTESASDVRPPSGTST